MAKFKIHNKKLEEEKIKFDKLRHQIYGEVNIIQSSLNYDKQLNSYQIDDEREFRLYLMAKGLL